MTEQGKGVDPLADFLKRDDLSSEQALEALRLIENRNADSDEVVLARMSAAEDRQKRSSWLSHPLTLALTTSLLTGGAVTAAFTYMSNKTTQIAETARQELQLKSSLESTALEQKFRAFESLIEIDPEVLLIQETDQLEFEERRQTFERERKRRICLSIAFGLIKVEPYMLPNLNEDYSEKDFAGELKTFLDDEFDCLKDNGGFVPSTFVAPTQTTIEEVGKTGRLSRIIVHWTGGNYTIAQTDRANYHEVVGQDGTRVLGIFPPEANLPPLKSGEYAAHVRGANSGSIGLAMAGMANARQAPFSSGPFPITISQVEGLCNAIVDYALRYNIPVTRETILTNAEVQPALGIQTLGKWDVTWLPGMDSSGDPVEVGDRLRKMVNAAIDSPTLPSGLPGRCEFADEAGE